MSTIKTTTLSTQGGSTVPVDTVVNGTAKAWVNFNGTGTVAIRRAFNVSSITDNGTGDYMVNFTTAMGNTDFASLMSHGAGNPGLHRDRATNESAYKRTVSQVGVASTSSQGSGNAYPEDNADVYTTIFS